MPQFDLRYINVAKYEQEDKQVHYTGKQTIGDAMNVNLELKFAEGRLYAEGRLSEYMKLATGGSISIAVKYIPQSAQVLLYGAKKGNKNISSKTIPSVKFTSADVASYVGVSFYAPDVIDGETKYTSVFVPKALFGPPSMSFETKGQGINFKTPTTSGEFLADDSEDETLLDVAVCDSIEEAKAWCDACLAGVE